MAIAPQLFVDITFPGQVATVERTFQVRGTLSFTTPATWTLANKSVTVQFGRGGPSVAATFTGSTLSFQCTGTVRPDVPWSSFVELGIQGSANFKVRVGRAFDIQDLSVATTFMVRLRPAVPPSVVLNPFPNPIVAGQVPIDFVFSGSATSPQAPIVAVQYKVENGQFSNAVNLTGNWSQFQIRLPLPPAPADKPHTLTIRATDTFGTVGEITHQVAVQPQPPIVVPPGAKTTLSGAPTTSSVTSWTRLEPQSSEADIGSSSSARLFDPLWMLARQWQMGEFQAEDAGTPVQARVRATTALITRRLSGALPKPTGVAPAAITATAYDPTRTPLEVLVERRRMRAADAHDARMLSFAVEAGLHFLRMLERVPLSKSYRAAFLAELALQPLQSDVTALVDDATQRYLQTMVGRAPDGRQLAALLRTLGPAQLVQDPSLNIANGDRAQVQQVAASWLTWYDSVCSEPEATSDEAWNPSRLEYALSVGARLSANPPTDITLTATELDGPIDWSAFDIERRVSLTSGDNSFRSLAEMTIPAPVTFPGTPAPRFWELEDSRLAIGLLPVGPTDLAHLMLIEYASSYGNDWFMVPLTLPVGSVTRVDSLVVTDTFGVRNLLRPIGDPALPPAFFSLWQQSLVSPALGSAGQAATNCFVLPPTLGRTIDSAPLEDVLFSRDEMSNLAWAIERTIESPIEQRAQREEAPDAAPPTSASDATNAPMPQYLLSSYVPPNWIPLLPVQVRNPAQPNAPKQVLTRLKRGAVLQLDGSKKVHAARGEVLLSLGDKLLFDEEVPREGALVTRQRRLARWIDGSTWFWTSFRNQVGQGESASGLQFDQLLEARAAAAKP